MKNAQTQSPRNEGVTIMMSFDEKSDYIRFCEERGVALSEMGRLALKDAMYNSQFWNDLRSAYEMDKHDCKELLTLIEKYYGRYSVASNNIKTLKRLIVQNNIIIPPDSLKKFNSNEYIRANR